MRVENILNPEKYGSGRKLFFFIIAGGQNTCPMLISIFFFHNYSVKGIFRQAMHEMPLITMASPFLIVGSGLILYHTYRYEKKDGNNKKYKLSYTRKYVIVN